MTVLELYRGTVNTWECDVNGHMNVQFYIGKASEGMAHLRRAIGLTPAIIAETGHSYAAVRALIRYRQELHAGDPLHIEARIVAMSEKTLTACIDVIRSADDVLSARLELTVCSFDLRARRAMPWAPAQRAAIETFLTEPPAALREPGTGGAPAYPDGVVPGEAILTARSAVKAWECDELGHFSAQFYMDRISDAVGHLFARMGLDQGERTRRNLATAALEYDVRFRRELHAGEVLSMRSGLLALGDKTFRAAHVMTEEVSGKVCATFDSVGVCIDMTARKAVPYPDDLRARAHDCFIAWPPEG